MNAKQKTKWSTYKVLINGESFEVDEMNLSGFIIDDRVWDLKPGETIKIEVTEIVT